MSGPDAVDPAESLAGLEALSDDQLVAVLSAATAGRAALEPVHAALARLAAERDPSALGRGATAQDRTSAEVVEEPAGPVAGGSDVHPTGGDSGTAGYSPEGVPTFESVRDRLEQRFGTAEGTAELDRHTETGRSADEQWEAREQAARERLERIRKSMRDDGAE